LTGIKLAGFEFHRLATAVLATMLSLPVVAAETSIQTIEWSDSASSAPDSADTQDASQSDVWQRIRDGFKIEDGAAANPLVAVHESWYAERPGSIRRMVERSRPYLFHIVEEIDRRAMPMEIALLPMVESAFNPAARSPASASGIWQFIPSTGRLYGLRQDAWYDGRRDFTASTRAALDYLGKLFLDFGDWQLALAAYNCGEGCVARAIQKNVERGLPTDYASLSLPTETRHYVPKLLAIKRLIGKPEAYGLAIDLLPNQPYFDQVTVHANMDVHSAARLADMSSDEFLALNAAFPRKLIRSDAPVNLLVPVDKVDAFQRKLKTGSWDSWKPYEAKRGERPEAIAKRFGIGVARLAEHNQLHLKRGKLAKTQTILVPVKRPGKAAAEEQSSQSSQDASLHFVKPGDTLYSIGLRYELSLSQLKETNPGLDGRIKPGQALRLPLGELSDPPAESTRKLAFTTKIRQAGQPVRYTVKRGDSLHAIAQRHDISLADLKAWNPAFKKRSTVRPGQKLVVEKPWMPFARR
jgi:membrane-bound lytic murein transglycosylase D